MLRPLMYVTFTPFSDIFRGSHKTFVYNKNILSHDPCDLDYPYQL